jgi:hypothetical protein
MGGCNDLHGYDACLQVHWRRGNHGQRKYAGKLQKPVTLARGPLYYRSHHVEKKWQRRATADLPDAEKNVESWVAVGRAIT